MDATRGATVNGRPVRDQAEAAQWIEGVIKGQMEQALSTEDKTLLMAANTKLLTHATIGMWLGSMVGVAYVFKGRFRAGQRAAAKSASGATNATPPRLFYPTNSTDPIGRGAANGPRAAQSRFAVIARGLGFGLAGAFVGSQIGVATGTGAAQKLIKDSGREQDIAKNLKRAMDQAVAEIKANSTGLEAASNPLLKRSTPFGTIESNSMDANGNRMVGADEFTQAESEAQNDAADDRDVFLSQDGSRNPKNLPPRSSSSRDPSAPSRWEELRKSRAAPPSSWDTIRDSSSRANVPAPGPADVSSSDGQNGNGYGSDLGSRGTSLAEKEARRRQFEELMDKERKGNDESFDEGKWK